MTMNAKRWLGRVLGHRLSHFAVLGGAIFAIAPRPTRLDRVDLSAAGLHELRVAAAHKLGETSLKPEQRREVDSRAIEDAILYREALKLGLDRDDPIIRERLIQKLLMLVEDLGGASRDPKPAELEAYFEAHRGRYLEADELHFVHVFADSRAALPDASALSSTKRALASGKAFPYPREQKLTREEIARLFGESFADGVEKLGPDGISAPLKSTFGWHRVRLIGREAGRPATLAEARSRVTLDYLLERREDVVGTFLTRTAKRYDVRIDGKAIESFEPTRRVAVRQQGSAED
jgi:peptidyl-prolyl cis-trans isomerase C